MEKIPCLKSDGKNKIKQLKYLSELKLIIKFAN